MSVDPTLLLRLDEGVRADLQAIRDSFFLWLLVSAGTVLFGVLLEGPEVIREMRKKALLVFPNIWSVHKAVSAPESQLVKLFKLLSFLGWFVLVLGLVGEGVFETFVSKVDGQLQRFDDILLADSIRYASAANERSKVLEKETVILRQQLIFQERRGTLLSETERTKAFVARLKPFAKQRFDIRYCRVPDSEISFFSLTLMGHLLGSLWELGDMSPALGCSPGMGLMLHPRASPSTKAAARALWDALFEAGVFVDPRHPELKNPGAHWLLSEDRSPKPGETLLQPSSVDTILIDVGSHP